MAEGENVVVLKTADGVDFEVPVSTIFLSTTINNLIHGAFSLSAPNHFQS